MPTITTKDGTSDLLQGLGEGAALVFSHGWPSDRGCLGRPDDFSGCSRIPLHRARSHEATGASGQTWDGNDMDTYADDVAELVAALDLRDAIHIGHSTGGGEVARYIGRHGTKRVAKAVLIGAIPPLMLKTPANPAGLPIEAFDQLRAASARGSRAVLQGSQRSLLRFQPARRQCVPGLRDSFWLQGMMAGISRCTTASRLSRRPISRKI